MIRKLLRKGFLVEIPQRLKLITNDHRDGLMIDFHFFPCLDPVVVCCQSLAKISEKFIRIMNRMKERKKSRFKEMDEKPSMQMETLITMNLSLPRKMKDNEPFWQVMQQNIYGTEVVSTRICEMQKQVELERFLSL